MSVTIKKREITQYVLRGGAFGDWAYVTIDERAGLVTIASDYGTWSYIWSAPGKKGLRWFLTDLDKSYFVSKMGGLRSHELDVEASIAAVRAKLIERKESLSEEEIAEIEDALDVGAGDEHEYRDLVRNDAIIDLLYEGEYTDLPWVKRVEPGLDAFYDRLWVPFAAHLKTELEQEAVG